METKTALKAMFFQPSAVFKGLKTDRKWVPAAIFIVLMLGLHAIIVSLGTYSENGVGELIDSQSPIDFTSVDPSQLELHRGNVENDQTHIDLKPASQATATDSRQVGAFIVWLFFLLAFLPVVFGFVCLLCLFDAIYFRIVAAVMKLEFKLGDWFAFCVWSRVPGIALGIAALVVAIIVLGRQPDSSELEILSLSRWVELPEVHYRGDSGSMAIDFDQLDGLLVWTIALQMIGFREWSGRSAAFSLGIVSLPSVFFYALALLAVSLA